jgi:hypothetical protein
MPASSSLRSERIRKIVSTSSNRSVRPAMLRNRNAGETLLVRSGSRTRCSQTSWTRLLPDRFTGDETTM